jgi:CheY-like chemotaxis protein
MGPVMVDSAHHSLAAVRDLSERETLEAQLRQAQKMEALGTLAGGIAHDFNNLMGAVLVSTATLKEELGRAHPSIASVETIERASRRAAELTRQLLSFARRKRLRVAPINLVDVVRDIGRMCARTFDRAIRIETLAPQDVVLVNGDAGQLEQALLNLCINSRDAMPDGGILTLDVRVRDIDEAAAHAIPLEAAGTWAVVSVSDTGIGMPPEVRQRLFEPFFTTKEQGKGTGLGLAMVYGIVKSHGGLVAVNSSTGGGTRVELFLPVVGEGAALPAPSLLVEEAQGGRETILLVDDEPDLRSAMARALRRLGYTVLEAENGRVALELLNGQPAVSMAILDLVMPVMGGVEAFGRMRQMRPGLPILLCSGYASAADVQGLLNQGANGFLPKPFETADLAREVRQVLDQAARVSAVESTLPGADPG